MIKFLKNLKKSQLEEILSEIFNEKVNIKHYHDSKNQLTILYELTRKNEDGKKEFARKTHYLDDYAVNNYFFQYTKDDTDEEDLLYDWQGEQTALFVFKMYEIFGKEYLDNCPNDIKKESIKYFNDSIKQYKKYNKEIDQEIESLKNQLKELVADKEFYTRSIYTLNKAKKLLNNKELEELDK